jgi:hypothetical protein
MTVTRGYAASSAWPKTSSSAVAAPAAMAGCTEIFHQRVITQPQATPGRDRRQQGDQLGGASKKNQAAAQVFPYSSWRRSQWVCSPSSWRPSGVRSSRP